MSDPAPIADETRLLAAMAYGEASTANDEREMFALASVLVRQMKARKYSSMQDFATKDKSFSFVVADGNARYTKLMKASSDSIEKDQGMSAAIKAAENALSGGTDHSNGAFFWDGADIKSNYTKHFKVRHGIRFSNPAHNIYDIQESSTKPIHLYKVTKKRVNGKVIIEKVLVASSDHVYESTAAHGGTIFWRQSPSYLQVTKSKEWL